MNRYYSHGKLLLSGEYLILDGAVGLAVPTTYGQDLVVQPSNTGTLLWESVDQNDLTWFEAEFDIESLETLYIEGSEAVAEQLQKVLSTARAMNPRFLTQPDGARVRTALEFPRDWGLGSSSTLVNNIARWADRNPFDLLFHSFGGSGYDIACANSEKALFYRLEQNRPKAYPIDFDPDFKDRLWFIHLNRKQRSKDSIEQYELNKDLDDTTLDHISAIGKEMARCTLLSDFQLLIEEHERIISGVIRVDPVQTSLFPDFPGQIKSLGAWGGDFILATSEKPVEDYFRSKGYETIIPFEQMVL